MILEDVFQVALRGPLIIQGWNYHGAPRESLFNSPQEGDCLLMGLVNSITKATSFPCYATCMYQFYYTCVAFRNMYG